MKVFAVSTTKETTQEVGKKKISVLRRDKVLHVSRSQRQVMNRANNANCDTIISCN